LTKKTSDGEKKGNRSFMQQWAEKERHMRPKRVSRQKNAGSIPPPSRWLERAYSDKKKMHGSRREEDNLESGSEERI